MKSLQTDMAPNFKEGFPRGSVVKNKPVNAGDTGSIPGSDKFLTEGYGNPLQYPHLENPMDRGAWRGRERVKLNLVTEK